MITPVVQSMEHLQKQIELMVDRIEKAIDKWENATLRLGQKEHERGGCVQRTSRSEPKAHLSVVWKSMRRIGSEDGILSASGADLTCTT
jgi:hypothetical protein